ncbi:hypothetical protein B0H11DRAFT_1923984 [Mycena galericulata]|nr:hypothetical protein B0H11DRAFT_1923984 [Mycena galericulata]
MTYYFHENSQSVLDITYKIIKNRVLARFRTEIGCGQAWARYIWITVMKALQTRANKRVAPTFSPLLLASTYHRPGTAMVREDGSIRFHGVKRKRSKGQRDQLLAARTSQSSLPMPSEASDAGKENAQVDHDALKIAKERGDSYQKKLYNGLKRLKRSHKANADQAAVLAETRLENGQLRAEVTQLTSDVADLQAELSILRAEVQSQKSARSQASKKLHVV